MNNIDILLKNQEEIDKLRKKTKPKRTHTFEMNEKHRSKVCNRFKEKTKKERFISSSTLRKCLFDDFLAENI